MTGVEFLTLALILTAAWGALVLSRLHDAREVVRAHRLELTEAWQHADIQARRADREAQASLAAHIAADSARKAMADAFDQRDDMQRRLAAATWPEGATHV